MTIWTHRLMIVPATNVATARQLAIDVAPKGNADNMWTVGLSPTGLDPATHYISSGLIDAQFASLLGDSAATFAANQAAGGTVPLGSIQALYAVTTLGSYIRNDAEGNELSCIATLGLKLIQATL